MKPKIRRVQRGLTLPILVHLLFTGYAAFGNSKRTEQDHLNHQHFAQLAKAPLKAQSRLNPLEGDPEAVPAGRKLFSQHCAECHGSTAEGSRNAPNLRAEEVQNATPGTLFWILTNGVVRRGMPVWSKLPEPERWQIVSFLKSLSASRKMEGDLEHTRAHSTHE